MQSWKDVAQGELGKMKKIVQLGTTNQGGLVHQRS